MTGNKVLFPARPGRHGYGFGLGISIRIRFTVWAACLPRARKKFSSVKVFLDLSEKLDSELRLDADASADLKHVRAAPRLSLLISGGMLR